jgi:hypothetical protein
MVGIGQWFCRDWSLDAFEVILAGRERLRRTVISISAVAPTGYPIIIAIDE